MKVVLHDTPERAAFRRDMREWLRSVLEPGWVEGIDDGDEDRYRAARAATEAKGFNFLSWTRTIGESGFGAPLWPKEYGGLSGEPWTQQVTREELKRYRLPLFGPNILGVGLAGPTIIAHGTEAQKEKYLRSILTGEHLWCQLFSEPGSGSDLASLSTRAERDGDEWIVNGQKVWTSIAQISTYGMCLARTDATVPKHEGLTYFIVDMRAPGVDIRPLRQMTGSAEFNEVYLTDVRVPDADRVGDVGEGWRCSRTTLANERDTIAGVSLDPMAILGGQQKDPWLAFVDGIAVRTDPVIRQGLARLYAEQEAKDATVLRANTTRLLGQQPGPEGSVNKIFNAEYNQRRAEFALNAAGMHGIAWVQGDSEAEQRAARFLRSRANTIEGGTSEVLRTAVAERILGLPREPEPDRGVPWNDTKRN